MGMRVTFNQPVPSPDMMFAADSFDRAVGTETQVRVSETETFPATIAAAEVSNDGLSVKITLDIPDEHAHRLPLP